MSCSVGNLLFHRENVLSETKSFIANMPSVMEKSSHNLDGKTGIWSNILWYLCRFYFDFSPTYIGCGLICPHIVNCSVLLGAIISWGFLWPFIAQRAGDWYPDNLEANDFKGLYGYKVCQVPGVF